MKPSDNNGQTSQGNKTSHPASVRIGAGVKPSLVAIDLGAESCRVSLLRWNNGEPEINLIHRFPNAPFTETDHLYWDLRHICEGVEHGLRLCAEIASEKIAAIGVDGWAVDYVHLNSEGQPIQNPFCYRDERSISAQKEVHQKISKERLYEITGIQFLPFNTLYQLYADGPKQNSSWLNVPEFVLHHLGAKKVSEYTNATHTQLLSANTGKWSEEIFSAVGLNLASAPPIVRPGTNLGRLKGPLASLQAFTATKLIAPACHDTASAIGGIPAPKDGRNWAFLSSGTWSLIGRVLDEPCFSTAAREANFSNEGGIGGKINFLKNVNGMWVLQQCMEEWQKQGAALAFESLVEECATFPRPDFLIDLDDPELLLPGNMLERINHQFSRRKLPAIPQTFSRAPVVANLIFHSLAARYAQVLSDLANITGLPIKYLYVVGGGSKNYLLNRLTEEATGIPVLTGSAESSTIGNFAVQLASLSGDYTNESGVRSSAVVQWASLLNQQAFKQIGPEKEAALSSCSSRGSS